MSRTALSLLYVCRSRTQLDAEECTISLLGESRFVITLRSGTTALNWYQCLLRITLPDIGKENGALPVCLKLVPLQRQLKAMTAVQAMLDGIEESGPGLRQPAAGGLSPLPDSKRQKPLPAPVALHLLEGAQAAEHDFKDACGQVAWQAGPATDIPSLEGAGGSPCMCLFMCLVACPHINSSLLTAPGACVESIL